MGKLRLREGVTLPKPTQLENGSVKILTHSLAAKSTFLTTKPYFLGRARGGVWVKSNVLCTFLPLINLVSWKKHFLVTGI